MEKGINHIFDKMHAASEVNPKLACYWDKLLHIEFPSTKTEPPTTTPPPTTTTGIQYLTYNNNEGVSGKRG